MYACSSGNYSLVKYLLDEQKTKDETSTIRIINERSNTGETCLMYAIESGNLDIVTLLCNHGAKLDNQKSPSYVTAAAFYGYRDVLEKLIQLGLDVNEFGKLDKEEKEIFEGRKQKSSRSKWWWGHFQSGLCVLPLWVSWMSTIITWG